MQLGTALENHTCARCYHRLTVPAVYRDNAWWHAKCHQEGSRQLVAGAKFGRATTTLVKSQRVKTSMIVSWTSHA
jgi:hypothetical protein